MLAAAHGGGAGARPPRPPLPRRRRGKPGFSRQSAIKKSTPVPSDPTVAVVFDTGMHGLGGRMATRTVDDDERQLVFDHAAQFFTASDERFQKLVDEWIEKGLVREWRGSIGELEAGGAFRPMPASTPRYIGVNGSARLWMQCCLREMCNRLLSSSGLPQLTRQMKRLELSSVWVLLAAFEDPLPIPHNDSYGTFEGAFVRYVDSLSWMANSTRKLFLLQTDRPQCWTYFSTASYGRRNQVPQENIPNVTAEKVK